METISDICENLGDATLQECQLILDNPQDPVAESFAMHLDKPVLESMISTVKGLRGEATNDNAIVKILKKISAYAVFNALNASTIEVKLLASRLLIITSSLPSASAFGVSNSNVIQALLTSLNKYFASELKGTTKPAAPEGNATNTVSINIHLSQDEDAMDTEHSQRARSSRSSKRLLQQNTADSEEEQTESDEDAENPFEEAKGPRSRAATAVALKDKLKPQHLAAFLPDLSTSVDLLANQSDEYVLNIGAELLMVIQFLCTVKPEFAASSSVSQKVMVSFGTKCKASLITAYRTLMPTLTMANRNPLLPDDVKEKRACHKAALTVVMDLMKASSQAPHLTIVEVAESDDSTATADDTRMETSAPNSPGSPSSSCSPADRRTSMGSTRSTSSSAAPAVVLPLAHTCLVGVLQRITLSPPDRAPVRQLLLTSLVDMISVLGKDIPTTACSSPEKLLPVLLSIEHYLVFLSKLSKSSKVAHRAFSLDITAQLLSTTWLWDLQCSASVNSDATDAAASSPSTVLLEVLQDRCMDCSPAVRTRALTAIHELLQNLNDDSSPAMMRALLDAVMAAKAPRSAGLPEDHTPRVSLLDMLRERATDDRPQVRTKALQAFGLALAMPWPKPSHQDDACAATASRSLDHVNMLIMDDDLEVFASHCRDTSLSVRKQAMLSLTELLVARPADALIQDVWVQSVIPMTFDAESSVANKVAESLHSLLFDNLIAWYQDEQDRSRGPSTASTVTDSRDLERQEYISLVWRLSSKFTAMGMFKILKSVLGIMLKQGYLNANPVGKNELKSASLLSVISALKYACCFHLRAADAASLDGSTTYGAIKNIRTSEPEEIARGAWILLEGLVSLEQMTILNAKQESIKFREFFRQAGSADFVVRCYRQKHAKDITIVWDEDDLRIFKVLEIMGASLSDEDTAYVKQQLMRNLQELQCDCHIAAAAIAVMLQLSKASVQDALITSADPLKVMVGAVTVWTAPLLAAVNTVLHTYTFGTRSASTLGTGVDPSSATGVLLQDWLNESFKTDTSMTFDVSMSADNGSHLTTNVLETVQSALFVLGEISMLGFSMEEDHFVSGQNQKKQSATNNSAARSAENFKIPVGEALVDLVKILMGHSLPLAGGVQRECPNKIRANAFVAMGKLCMRNKTLARNNVNIYLREVSSSTSASARADVSTLTADVSHHNRSSTSVASLVAAAAAVRSNALLVLGDMCIRYTNLVDRHVDTMAQCLQDSDSLVRKNALILLTQLLLQDFLKWKGFLLYRFLVLTVDADHEIAEFSRNILQKTLSLKYPQLLTTHFTEALVILNGCTAHPAYSSIARTGTMSDGAADSLLGNDAPSMSSSQMDADGDDNMPPVDVHFTCALTKAQRFGVYAFMAENMDDETKIQVSAKLVQDILSAAVDSTSLLPQPNKLGKKNERGKYSAFEAVLEDALTLMRTPHLKVGQKKGGADEGDDAQDEDVGAAGADVAGGNNAKAAFVRAKSKVLKKLSTQHLISHTLPVIISLKHVLEASKSPLQGTLMEFVVSLVKNHKNEVEEALQFDPTLRSEIEYDLKQFERAKKEKLAAVISAFSAKKGPNGMRSAPGTMQSARKPLSPYLDLQHLPAQSIVKPSLRKSLGGEASRGRTPYDALKSPGMHLARSAIRSVLASTAASGSVRVVDDGNDDVDRLTFSQMEAGAALVPSEVANGDHAAEMLDVDHTAQALFGNDDVSDRAADAGVHSSCKQSRRRSWGVVVDSLLPASSISPASEANTSRSSLGSSVGAAGSSSKERVSPPKKKRCRKSTTPVKSAAKEVSFQQLAPVEHAVLSENLPENRAPSHNVVHERGDSELPVKAAVSRGGARAGSNAGGNTLLTTLSAPPATAQDAAVNAFDRLLASASVPKVAPPRGAPVADTNKGGARQGKRGATQQNSLMGMF